MSDNVQLKAKLLDLLEQRYQKDPGFFVNKSTISVELGITEEEAFRYADYLVNNKWATISEPYESSWRIMITDEGKKELMRMKEIITKAMKEKPKNNTKSDTRLRKIQEQIEEKKLEAERRKAVVETKKLGAEIEIITILREELKRRDDATEKIPEIKKQLDKIEDKLSQLTVIQATVEFQEDRMYKDVLEKNENSVSFYGSTWVTDAKKSYAKIKILRSQIRDISKDLENETNAFDRNRLNSNKQQLNSELSQELEKLADLWSSHS